MHLCGHSVSLLHIYLLSTLLLQIHPFPLKHLHSVYVCKHPSLYTYTYSLGELPECQVPIASEYNLLRQVAMLILSPSYKYIASLVSVAGLVCLAYKTETHRHLVKRDIMEGVVEATCMPRSLYGVTQEELQESQTLLR